MSLMDDVRADRLVAVADRLGFYNASRKYFTLVNLVLGPLSFLVDAQFGRFAPQDDSIFNVDMIKSWMVMEIVSPICFIATFLTSPISLSPENDKNMAQLILAGCFVVHYTNRAIISPLRTPSRSKAHISVPASAVVFNLFNGSMLGTYLSSRGAQHYLATASQRPSFWIGLGLWAVGFAGNILHDEILLNIRRKAKTGKKDKPQTRGGNGKSTGTKEHYAIPEGWLYKYVSYPNYFCEWVEWAGFALAASPMPFFTNPTVLLNAISSVLDVRRPAESFAPLLTPPWMFFLSEVLVMFPRAYKGHKWYHDKFGDRYPKERKIAIPGLL